MLTRTFIKKVRELGFDVVKEDDELIISKDEKFVAIINENIERCLSTTCATLIKDVEKRSELLKLCFDYANTSIINRIDLTDVNVTDLMHEIQNLKYVFEHPTEELDVYTAIKDLLHEYERTTSNAKGL